MQYKFSSRGPVKIRPKSPVGHRNLASSYSGGLTRVFLNGLFQKWAFILLTLAKLRC